MKRIVIAILAVFFLWPTTVSAHDVPDHVSITAYLKPENGRMLILVRMPANALIDFAFPTLDEGNWLDLKQVADLPRDGAEVWIADLLSIYENGTALPRPKVIATHLSRVDDAAFGSFESALSHIKSDELPVTSLVTQDTATVDALLETPIHSVNSDFSFKPRFERVGVRVTTTLSFLPASGGIRQFQYDADPDTFELDPSVWHDTVHFLKAGFDHYLDQTDYWLFVLCVALVLKRFRMLLSFSIAFAVAQSCALLGSLAVLPTALWTPVLGGILIAAATVYMGIEAIVTESAETKMLDIAIVTGLIFGWGSWFGLQPSIQFAVTHPLASTVGFDIGFLLAEICVLAVLSVAVHVLFRYSSAARVISIIAAAIAIHVSWHRMLDRADGFSLVAFTLPGVDQSMVLFGGTIAIVAVTAVLYYSRRNVFLGVGRSGA